MVPEGQPVGQPGSFERRGAAGKLATRLSVLATVVATFLFGMYWGFWRVAVVLIGAQGRANVDPDDYLDQIHTAGLWGNLCRKRVLVRRRGGGCREGDPCAYRRISMAA